jgi:hypothetical protein
LLEVAGHGEGHTDECTFGGSIRNLTGLTIKLRILFFQLKVDEEKKENAQRPNSPP